MQNINYWDLDYERQQWMRSKHFLEMFLLPLRILEWTYNYNSLHSSTANREVNQIYGPKSHVAVLLITCLTAGSWSYLLVCRLATEKGRFMKAQTLVILHSHKTLTYLLCRLTWGEGSQWELCPWKNLHLFLNHISWSGEHSAWTVGYMCLFLESEAK